jgi:hypothetical protein
MDTSAATYTQSAELFGVSIPLGDPALASCGKVEWKDGEYQDPPSCTAARDALDVVDATKIRKVTFSVPLPVGCDAEIGSASGASLAVKTEGPLCYEEWSFVGPVPVTVEASVAIAAEVSFGAEIDPETMEPAFAVTPGVSIGLDVKGGVGIGNYVLSLEAGVKAAITIIDIEFPISWALDVAQGTYSSTSAAVLAGTAKAGDTVPNLWIASYERKVDVELTFLQLYLDLFFEAGIGPFVAEWDFPLVSFGGITLSWSIDDTVLESTKCDFDWDGEAAGCAHGSP